MVMLLMLVVVVVMLMMLVDRCCNVVDVGSCSSNVDDNGG